jgi:hypothetical protein
VYDRRHALSVAPARQWTPAEDHLVRTLPGVEAARRTGRTLRAVYQRRQAFGGARQRAGMTHQDDTPASAAQQP